MYISILTVGRGVKFGGGKVNHSLSQLRRSTTMTENFDMYVETHDSLPGELMQRIADEMQPAEFTKRGRTYTYRWPDLAIQVKAVTSRKRSGMVTEMMRYIQMIDCPIPPLFSRSAIRILRSQTPERIKRFLRRMHRTRLVLTIVVKPGPDDEGRMNRLYGYLCRELRPVHRFSNGHTFHDWKGRVILDHFGPYDRKAVID